MSLRIPARKSIRQPSITPSRILDEKEEADGGGATSKEDDDVAGKTECPNTPGLYLDPALATELGPPGLSNPICIQRSLMGWALIDCADRGVGSDCVAGAAACFFSFCSGS